MYQLDMPQTHHSHSSRSPPTGPALIDTSISRSNGSHISPSTPGVAGTASRFFVSMRKSFSPPTSPRRKNTENPRAAMYSTPEERRTYDTSRAGRSRHLDSRPTIEQIAMGLHVSCTPHLRPAPNLPPRYPLPSPPSCRSLNTPIQCPSVSPDHFQDTSSSSSHHPTTQHSLPSPPRRSSMKKTSSSASTLTHPQQQFLSSGVSQSPSVVSSGSPATSPSSRPLSSLRSRMSKFIPGYRPLSLPSSLGRASSFTSSASDSTRPTTPRKAVRFSTSVLAIDEQS